MKQILYVGETTDFSDVWLIEQLRTQYNLELLDIAQDEKYIPAANEDFLIINRLYASAFERHGNSMVHVALGIVDQLSFRGVSVINSTKG